MSGLTEASQIMSIVTGATVLGGAAVAIFKWNAIIQMIVRIAQGHPDRQDIDNIEEGIASNPAVREAAATAQTALRAAGLRRAAQNVGAVRENAHNRTQGPQPVNIQLNQQPGRAVRVDVQQATRDRTANTSPLAPRRSPPRVRSVQSGSPPSAANQGASQSRTSPPRVRNLQSSARNSVLYQGDVETAFRPQPIRNVHPGPENGLPNARPQEIQEYYQVQQLDPSIGSSSVLQSEGHGQTRERLARGTPSSKGGKTSNRRAGAHAGVTRESFKHNTLHEGGI